LTKLLKPSILFELLLRFLLEDPASAFLLVGLIVYRKPIWFLALLCSATLFYMGLEVGILLSHRESVNQLGAAYFSDNGPQLIEVDIEGALPERVRRAIVPIVPTDTSGKTFHAFVVMDCRESALVAFTNPIGSGFVFLREMPNLQSAVGRFKLFHELGHLSSTARFNSFIETSMKLRFLNTFGVVLSSLQPTWWYCLLGPFYDACMRRKRWIAEVAQELVADSFACWAFDDLGELEKALDALLKESESDANTAIDCGVEFTKYGLKEKQHRHMQMAKALDQLRKGKKTPFGLSNVVITPTYLCFALATPLLAVFKASGLIWPVFVYQVPSIIGLIRLWRNLRRQSAELETRLAEALTDGRIKRSSRV
jgi:hypothetical protein